jgi:hypothetical protein
MSGRLSIDFAGVPGNKFLFLQMISFFTKNFPILMKFSGILFLSLIGLMTFNSCVKDEADISIIGIWHLSDLKTDKDGDGIYTSVIEECQKDDTATFGEGGEYIGDSGSVKCHEFDAQSILGTWLLSEDGTELSFTVDGNTITSDVITLSKHIMILRVTDFGSIYEDLSEATLIR